MPEAIDWLRKVRPWFSIARICVRLRCPADSFGANQPLPPPGVDAALNCKGSNRQKHGTTSLRRR